MQIQHTHAVLQHSGVSGPPGRQTIYLASTQKLLLTGKVAKKKKKKKLAASTWPLPHTPTLRVSEEGSINA